MAKQGKTLVRNETSRNYNGVLPGQTVEVPESELIGYIAAGFSEISDPEADAKAAAAAEAEAKAKAEADAKATAAAK